GALVADPQANGPAAKAGVMAGDVIIAVNGNPVKDARDLARQIGSMAPGATAKLTVWRKGEEKTFSIALGELPNQREARATTMPDSSGAEGTDVPRLGLTVLPVGPRRGGATGGSSSPAKSPAAAGKAWWLPTSIPTGLPPTRASRPATSFSRSAARRLPIRPTSAVPSRTHRRTASVRSSCG